MHIIKSFVLSQNNSRFPLLLTLSSHVNLKLRILQSSSSAPYLYYYHSLLLTMKSFVTNGRRVSFFFFFFFFVVLTHHFRVAIFLRNLHVEFMSAMLEPASSIKTLLRRYTQNKQPTNAHDTTDAHVQNVDKYFFHKSTVFILESQPIHTT